MAMRRYRAGWPPGDTGVHLHGLHARLAAQGPSGSRARQSGLAGRCCGLLRRHGRCRRAGPARGRGRQARRAGSRRASPGPVRRRRRARGGLGRARRPACRRRVRVAPWRSRPRPGHRPGAVRAADQATMSAELAASVGGAVMERLGGRLRRGVAIWLVRAGAPASAQERPWTQGRASPARPPRHGHVARHGKIDCMLRWLTAGESHGRALVAICEGLPAGVEINTADVAAAGPPSGRVRPRRADEVRAGRGRDHVAVSGMAARSAARSRSRLRTPSGRSGRRSCRPTRYRLPTSQIRPATSRLPGRGPVMPTWPECRRYGHDDARPILERASARETAARVAVGEVARRFLAQAAGAAVLSHVVAIGGVTVPAGRRPDRQTARPWTPILSVAWIR